MMRKKRWRVALFLTVIAAALVGLAVAADTGITKLAPGVLSKVSPTLDVSKGPPTCATLHWSNVRIRCKKDASGSAVGNYGGAGFSVSCEAGGAGLVQICNNTFDYDFDINTSVSCPHYSGDSVSVSEACDGIQVTIN